MIMGGQRRQGFDHLALGVLLTGVLLIELRDDVAEVAFGDAAVHLVLRGSRQAITARPVAIVIVIAAAEVGGSAAGGFGDRRHLEPPRQIHSAGEDDAMAAIAALRAERVAPVLF